MLLEREQWDLGYAQLLRDCRGLPDSSSHRHNAHNDDYGDGNDFLSHNNLSGGGNAIGNYGNIGRVLILVNVDADAMAAARILSFMLRADGVPYQLKPCTGFMRMKRHLEKIGVIGVDETVTDGEGSEAGDNGGRWNGSHQVNGDGDHGGQVGMIGDVRAVVLINMGANRNLAKLFASSVGMDDPENARGSFSGLGGGSHRNCRCRCYVFDCHRPYHLSNIHAGRNVVLFNDRPMEEGEVPSDGDNLSGDESSSSSEEEGDSDDDSDNEEGSDNGRRHREEDDEGEEEFEGEDVIGTAAPDPLQRDRDDGNDGDESEVEASDIEDDEDHQVRRKAAKRQRPDRPMQPQDEYDAFHVSGLQKQKLRTDDDDDLEEDNPLDVTAATADLTPPTQDDSPDDASTTSNTNIAPTSSPQTTQMTFRELHRQRRNRIRLHYSAGAYHASPSAWSIYTLSSQLRFGDISDLLWLACVGVTDAYLHGRLDVAGYSALCVDLKRHVSRLFPNELVDRANRAIYAEELEEGTFGGSHRTNGRGGEAWTQIGLSENGRILCQSEYRFLLLRHTSLWDSMFHSNFIASKLQVWRNEGKLKLMELLAKMGFPLDQCRQPFAFVHPGMRRKLRENVDEHAEEYGLENVSYTGFVRVTGYKSLLSASDMSYAVTALLECSATAMDGLSGNDDDETLTEEDKEDRDLVQAFNVAFDALNSNGATSSAAITALEGGVEGSDLSNLVNGGSMTGTTGLGAGIRLAMTLQRSIMNTARNLVDRNAIIRLNHFRYAYLQCTSGGSTSGAGGRVVTPDTSKDGRGKYHVFAKPLVLTKLAQFLMDMHRENGKWTGTKARPLVLLAEKPRSGTYMVVGYEYPEEAGNVVRNKFGQNFELAAKTMKGTFWFDSFDSNVVEVAGKDVQRFIEQLHYMMESV
mmetsp:Transcript_28831/g.61174  ORF Transcript_28831/g.61174 Transcript_28831/m.61174 type:complete len:917 (+) Transcript_28831:232-2982(+)|eukprot:CAMPEP_0171345198 /NCGR_PEP_ID=MMETSP0878-20121228/20959_1 /TAXON_ID=67004 /ORGANISM="Thalassiosira weissflogii, Strain CCMP1336" /LENGTH=916 /DNA_ID=CAMNT_0011848551 /DNA_START=144 /DNA_END=2894 /DNA_ORIENTATION=-